MSPSLTCLVSLLSLQTTFSSHTFTPLYTYRSCSFFLHSFFSDFLFFSHFWMLLSLPSLLKKISVFSLYICCCSYIVDRPNTLQLPCPSIVAHTLSLQMLPKKGCMYVVLVYWVTHRELMAPGAVHNLKSEDSLCTPPSHQVKLGPLSFLILSLGK